jgi:hypothetical protein
MDTPLQQTQELCYKVKTKPVWSKASWESVEQVPH